MSKEPDENEGSMVTSQDTEAQKVSKDDAMNRIVNALEATAKVVSGIGVTLVTVKSSIDDLTKQLVKTEDRVNSLVTLLAVGKRIDGEDEKQKPTTVKPEPKPTPTPQPTPEPKPETKPTEQTSISQPQPPLPEPTPASTPSTPLDEIRMIFPEDLEALLNFEDKGDYITIKPKQFLGSENFAKIASAVRGAGGEYISAGKDSHFRIKKK